MSDRITLDYSRMLAAATGGRGLEDVQLENAAARFRDAHVDVERRREAGQLGFFALPYERKVVEQIRSFADGLGQAYDSIVVLGIGGSALGTIALQNALLKPH
ncbi:MAG TPA: hypothetical protein VHG09_14120, partial [Longimicrobiales bacterium]|nr:hypothetical protein [Longimicrobiales bacterium]